MNSSLLRTEMEYQHRLKFESKILFKYSGFGLEMILEIVHDNLIKQNNFIIPTKKFCKLDLSLI